MANCERRHHIPAPAPAAIEHCRRCGLGLKSATSWGGSSAGRAPRSQCGGREFDPPPLHQDFRARVSLALFFSALPLAEFEAACELFPIVSSDGFPPPRRTGACRVRPKVWPLCRRRSQRPATVKFDLTQQRAADQPTCSRERVRYQRHGSSNLGVEAA